jgi:hypothetical protein
MNSVTKLLSNGKEKNNDRNNFIHDRAIVVANAIIVVTVVTASVSATALLL